MSIFFFKYFFLTKKNVFVKIYINEKEISYPWGFEIIANTLSQTGKELL